LNSDQSKEISFHLLKCLWISLLQISKRLPETKSVSVPKWMKYNRDWIELTVAAEMVKRHSGQGKAPTLSLRPVEDNSTLAQ